VPVGSAAEAILDNIEIVFDTPPYIAVMPKEEIYSYDAVLENTTTGQSIMIHFISALNEPLTINCETKTVTGGELGLSVPYAIDCTDEVDWLYLVPGVNALKWTESSIGGLGIVTTWRGRWS
jgi:phage-related protein